MLGRLVSGDESDAPQITTAEDWHVGFGWRACVLSVGMIDLKDLNTQIASDSAIVLTTAIGINNMGIIVAVGAVSGCHASSCRPGPCIYPLTKS